MTPVTSKHPERASRTGVDRAKAPTGQWLAGVVIAICAAAGVMTTIADGVETLLTVWPWLGLVAGGAWALYWRPEVVVSDAGVRLVNVVRTVDIAWPALRRIETKWALTLHTEWGRYRAWAAPAPGRTGMRHQLRQHTTVSGKPITSDDTERATRAIERRVPGTAPGGTYGRVGDLPVTDSGAAAQLVSARWRRVRASGQLGTAPEAAPIRWHWELAAGAAGLIALGVLGLAL